MRNRVLKKTKVICMILVALMVFTTAFWNMDFKVFAEEPEDVIETEIEAPETETVEVVDVDVAEEAPEAVEEETAEDEEEVAEEVAEEETEAVEEEAASEEDEIVVAAEDEESEDAEAVEEEVEEAVEEDAETVEEETEEALEEEAEAVESEKEEDTEAVVDEAEVEEEAEAIEDLEFLELEDELSEEELEEVAEEDLLTLEADELSIDFSVPVAVCSESDIPSVEEYFEQEVDQALYPKYNASTYNGDNLKGLNRKFYDKLKIMAGDITAGKRTSTKCRMSVSELGINKAYTAAELGQSTINNAAAQQLLYEIGWDQINVGLVTDALSMDCPYEMYWRGLYSSIDEYPEFDITTKNNQPALRLKGYVTYSIAASYEYKGSDDYTVNKSKVTAAKKASKKINEIINNAKSKTDKEKVTYYKNQICALTTYNFDAMNSTIPNYYGDPWQLIYVFDGDKSTNVVCEGYSKAFAYLCEKTNFADSSINCYIATGTMDGGLHMWNILHWSDGKNYLVDVTNCDDISNDLFMAVPKSGSVSAGYTYKILNTTTKFVYDDDTLAQYTTKELTIGSKQTSTLKDISLEYDPYIVSGVAVPFTVVREGGTNKTQFSLVSVVDSKKNTIQKGSYGKDNVIKVTFPSKGKYTLKFAAKDSDGTVKSRTITVDVKKGKEVENFVSRFYTIILDRQAEKEGLQNWVTALEAGTRGGADVADEFIHSAEFQSKKISDDAYVTKLYRAFFDREPDAAGKKAWLNALKSGKSRDYVLEGFLASDEYRDLCNKYGIKRESTRTFVKRFYTIALGRTSDKISGAELDNWQVALDSGSVNGADIAIAFFHSPEYLGHNDNNNAYLKKLYKVLFNRDMDAGGKQVWTQAFAQGATRDAVLEEFLKSQEFKDMCKMYGINPGR